MNGNAIWDAVVVGGGPAGMMAAGRAAEKGAKVILIEKNDMLGKKLVLTGGGRCNFTNSEFDIRKFLEKFKGDGKYLFSAFARWGVKETLEFFHKRGVETKVENDLRTFPVSDSAQTILDALAGYMEENGVTVLYNSSVTEIVNKAGALIGVKLKSGEVIRGRSIIIAAGGTARPETGSAGDGYLWLKNIGHTVIKPSPSLVPIAIKDKWVKELAGISLNDVKITALQNDKKVISIKGKILFTHTGVSGPTILNMSKDIGEMLKRGEVIISADLFPAEGHGAVNAKLQDLFKKHDKKLLRNALSDIVPAALSPVIMGISGIDEDVPCHGVTREERMKMVEILKGFSMRADKLLGAEMAIVASGGILPKEVDFRTMRSRLFLNLYLAGDILDINRPSGGYSLQLCWTTGYVAGDSVSTHTDI